MFSYSARSQSYDVVASYTVDFQVVPVGQSLIKIVVGSTAAYIQDYTISAVLVKGSDPDFVLDSPNCVATDNPKIEDCSLPVTFTPTSTAFKQGTVTALVSFYLCEDFSCDQRTLFQELRTIYLIGGNPQEATLVTAQSMRAAQVIYSQPSPANFDVVQGKSMGFEVTLAAINNENSTDSVIVQVVDASGNILSHSLNAIPVSSIGPFGLIVPANAMSTYVPLTSGPIQTVVQFDVSRAPNTTAMKMTGPVLNVFKTYTPTIGLVQIGDCRGLHTCYGATNSGNFSTLLGQQTYVSDVFPVADNSLKLTPISGTFNGSPDKTGLNVSGGSDNGISADLLDLGFKKLVLGFQRLVAIVPAGYFPYHLEGFNAAGMTLHSNSVSLVNELAAGGTLPHELGHGLGTVDLYDPETGLYTGPYQDGFNARTTTSIFHLPSFMGSDQGALSKVWVDSKSYSVMFSSLLSTPIDPDVIIVSGLLSDTGVFTFGPSKELSSGVLTQSVTGGDIKVSTLDSNNIEISSVSLKSDFTASISYFNGGKGPTSLKMSSIPVVVALPNNSNVASFQISQNGKQVAKASSSAQVLLQIIQSIPDNAFRVKEKCWSDDNIKKESVSRISNIRKHLLKKVASIQNELNSQENKKAKRSLEKLVEKIKSITYENYTVSDVTQSNQQQVIAELQSIIKKIEICKNDHCHK